MAQNTQYYTARERDRGRLMNGSLATEAFLFGSYLSLFRYLFFRRRRRAIRLVHSMPRAQALDPARATVNIT